MKLRPYLFSPDSDVFLSQNSKGDFICQFCSLVHEDFFRAEDAGCMLAHLDEHIDDEDKVPEQLIVDLKQINAGPSE